MGLVAGPHSFRPAGVSLWDAIVAAGETADCKGCVDPSSLDSYPGAGQTLFDLSGNALNFTLGADGAVTTDDPSFNGPAGTLSRRVSNMEVDGGDFMRSTTLPAWVQTLHKSASIFSWMGIVSVAAADNGTLLTNRKTPPNDPQVSIFFTSAGKYKFTCNSHTSALVFEAVSDATYPLNEWGVYGGSIHDGGGAVSFLYRNGAYDQVGSSDLFATTYASPSPNDTDKLDLLGAHAGSGTTPLAAGSKFGGIAIWQGRILSKTQMDKIFAVLGGVPGI